MDNTFVCKSMFTWYKEMLNLDQQVTDETIIIAAEVCYSRVWPFKCLPSITQTAFRVEIFIRLAISKAS